MAESPRPFQTINQSAMRSGLFLGGWGVAGVFLATFALAYPSLALVTDVVLLGSPVIAWKLTDHYAKTCADVQGYFTFGAGFSFCSLMGTYAMLWILIAVAFVINDEGTGLLTTNLIAQVETPEYRQALQETGVLNNLDIATKGKGFETLIESIRSLSRIDAMTLILFANLFINPIFSLFIGLLCRKDGMPKHK